VTASATASKELRKGKLASNSHGKEGYGRDISSQQDCEKKKDETKVVCKSTLHDSDSRYPPHLSHPPPLTMAKRLKQLELERELADANKDAAAAREQILKRERLVELLELEQAAKQEQSALLALKASQNAAKKAADDEAVAAAAAAAIAIDEADKRTQKAADEAVAAAAAVAKERNRTAPFSTPWLTPVEIFGFVSTSQENDGYVFQPSSIPSSPMHYSSSPLPQHYSSTPLPQHYSPSSLPQMQQFTSFSIPLRSESHLHPLNPALYYQQQSQIQELQSRGAQLTHQVAQLTQAAQSAAHFASYSMSQQFQGMCNDALLYQVTAPLPQQYQQMQFPFPLSFLPQRLMPQLQTQMPQPQPQQQLEQYHHVYQPPLNVLSPQHVALHDALTVVGDAVESRVAQASAQQQTFYELLNRLRGDLLAEGPSHAPQELSGKTTHNETSSSGTLQALGGSSSAVLSSSSSSFSTPPPPSSSSLSSSLSSNGQNLSTTSTSLPQSSRTSFLPAPIPVPVSTPPATVSWSVRPPNFSSLKSPRVERID